MLSPELSPFCLKAGSIRRSSSRRRRSHRTLSEETTEEAAEDKYDLLDELIVRYPALLMSLRDCVHPICNTVLALTPHVSPRSLLCLLCRPTRCWPRSPRIPSAPGEEARSASSARFGCATTQKPTSGTTSTVFTAMPSGVGPAPWQRPGSGGRAACAATARRSSHPATTSTAGSTSPWTRTASPLWVSTLPPPFLPTARRGSGKIW